MRLKASLATDLKNARNTLTQRIQGPSSEGTVEMDLSKLKDGNVAGFGVFQFPYAYVAVQQEGNTRNVVMCNNGKIVDIPIREPKQNRIWFRVRATDKDFTARFYYSLDGKEFIQTGDVLNMDLGLYWTANRFALLNFSTKEQGVGGMADFNWFRFHNK